MSDEANSNINLGNDVQVIRNILVGEHLEKFQKQLDALVKEINALKKENKILRKELEAENEKRFQGLIAQLEQVRSGQDESSSSLRKDFDSQIKDMSKRLLAYEDKQGGLISSLANALLEYKDKSGK